MKLTPVTGPGAIQDLSTPPAVRDARLTQKFNQILESKQVPQSTAQEHPVHNPNQVSVEELGAIRQKAAPVEDNGGDVDAPVATEPEKPKEDPALSRQFAQLARQERALRAKQQQQDQAFKQREAELAAREAALTGKSTFDPNEYIPRSRLKQDALSALEEAGVTYDEVTQQVMSRQPTDPRVNATISRLEAKIAQLEQANDNNQKSYQEQQQAQYQAAVKQIELDTRQLVKNDPNFETIKATGSVKDVVELITQTYEKDGVLLTVEEAAQQVEDYLMEEAMKVTRIGKIKARIEQANASSKPSDVKPQATQKQTQPGMKTLTNATSSSRQLSVRERAIAAMEGRLK